MAKVYLGRAEPGTEQAAKRPGKGLLMLSAKSGSRGLGVDSYLPFHSVHLL